MDRAKALAAIDVYCGLPGLYLDPTDKYPNTLIIRLSDPANAKINGTAYNNIYDKANKQVFFFRTLWPDDQSGCTTPTK